MDIVNSLVTSLFGISVVFAVLVSLIFLIYLQSYVMKIIHPEKKAVPAAAPVEPVQAPAPALVSSVPGKLELVGIDEKTAAMVMAVVCDECGIPANELIFKSIREIA